MRREDVIQEFARLAVGYPGDQPYFVGGEAALLAAALFLADAETGRPDPAHACKLLRLPREELTKRFEMFWDKVPEAGRKAWESVRDHSLFEAFKEAVLAKCC